MKTKAELEEIIATLHLRVAELEGRVAAYEFALAHSPQQFSVPANDMNWWWPQVHPTISQPFQITS